MRASRLIQQKWAVWFNIRGLPIPDATVVDIVAVGMTLDEIIADYPDLKREDIYEALHYAVTALRKRQLPQVVLIKISRFELKSSDDL